MKKKMIYFLIPMFAIALTIVIVVASNPLRKSEERIRSDMLLLTPVGTCMEDVIAVIENNDTWVREWVDHEYGYAVLHGRPMRYGLYGYEDGRRVNPDYKVVGEKSIFVTIGQYKQAVFFHTFVIVFYGFDENSELIDIAVLKEVDSF